MKQPVPQKTLQENTLFGQGDVFVLFGELFGRGYATGLVNEAKAAGMTIIGITVGRRDENNTLRKLTDEELATAEANLGGKIINVPLMAGFDLDAPAGEPTPTDLVNALTVDTWQDEKLDFDHIEKCRQLGQTRFKTALAEVMEQIDALIPSGKNVYFAHTMAGGIPKAKVFLVIANRIYKGRGARHMSSQALIDSDLGKLILQNFDEVSANTFGYLLEASSKIRERVEASGGQVRYTAYGYHGTSVLIDGEYKWQTYTNYTQGYAKMRLENFAKAAWDKGIKASVFNCPEIRTNSSDVFAGLELSLLPLLDALRHEQGGAFADAVWAECQALLKDGVALEDLLQKVRDFQASPEMQPYYNFEAWPMPNSPGQAEQTIGTSQDIVNLHKDLKVLVSDALSHHVLNATGRLIFGAASDPEGPVLWLNHDVVAKQLIKDNA
ncbi:enoyl ACP reductase FabMG family protein [Falsigemmobacter intermedius]|uniref:enoyl ACP reductase FabMG family protein n=1 Tax=Falsigemmobacter intermedius TaxID=1553448 RepID=UPI003F05C677